MACLLHKTSVLRRVGIVNNRRLITSNHCDSDCGGGDMEDMVTDWFRRQSGSAAATLISRRAGASKREHRKTLGSDLFSKTLVDSVRGFLRHAQAIENQSRRIVVPRH